MSSTSVEKTYIYDVKSTATKHYLTQKSGLEWLAAAHAVAEKKKGSDEDLDALRSRFYKLLFRFGCGPEKISRRGHMIPDFNSMRFSELETYNLDQNPSGASVEARGAVFQREAWEYLQNVYAQVAVAPSDLLHVSCTGYVSPSAAQKIVAAKNWGAQTDVTHAYHMGCYASIPALRMAVATSRTKNAESGKRVDVVHTELCTLHLNPADHSPEQLVVQSLFADGLISYSVGNEASFLSSKAKTVTTDSSRLEVLSVKEEIIPDSEEAMSWVVSPSGFRMTLSRKVPEMISDSLEGFLKRIFGQAGLNLDEERQDAIFAIHPGGPRIIEGLEESLKLSPQQVAHSKAILFDHGNMSSATLPHVWERILRDRDVEAGTVIVGLAFGPGLTCAGCLLRKV